MKALVVPYKAATKLTDLIIRNQAVPEIGPHQVLVKVTYAALNPVDYKLVASSNAKWTFPHVLGVDAVGVIVKKGHQVVDYSVGDRVSAHNDLAKDGCFAEYAVMADYAIAKVPEAVSDEAAVAVLCAGLTAYQALFRKMNRIGKQTILIHAGAGGVGSIALQLANTAGLKVYTTVSSRKAAFVKKIAPFATQINYQKEDVTKKIVDYTQGIGVDLILNVLDQQTVTEDFKRLAFNGQVVAVDAVPDFSKLNMAVKGQGIATVFLGLVHQSNHFEQKRDLGVMNGELLQLVAAKKVTPAIEKVIDLSDVPAALSDLKAGKILGKVIVKLS
jgi:NADPH:quinone reductase-like Zn-dependent oxidoreductase